MTFHKRGIHDSVSNTVRFTVNRSCLVAAKIRASWLTRREDHLDDLRPHLVVVPDPGVTAMIEAIKLCTGNLASRVLGAGVGAVPVVTRTDDQRRCTDRR